jgi:hypothetical protein
LFIRFMSLYIYIYTYIIKRQNLLFYFL